MPTRITSEETKRLALKMRARFLLPFRVEDQLEKVVEVCQSLPEMLRPQCQAFADSLVAVHATTTLPYQLAQSKANALHFQRLHMVERIRSIPVHEKDYAVPQNERDQNALLNTHERFSAFRESDDGINTLVADLAGTLLEAIEQPSTSKAADELLYQAVVGIWSAFEILVRDEFIVLLNQYPKLAALLVNNVHSRKYFELPKLSIDQLSDSRYDLSTSMGTLIVGTRDFSDARTIRAAVSAISNDAKQIEALNADSLWDLNQCRHLIVHRRGVVDEKYKASTKCPLSIGERISVSPQDVEEYFLIAIQSATAVLGAIASAVSNN